jgi:hypothetical protein
MNARLALALALVVALAACGHSGPSGPFPLEWRGVDSPPAASPAVSDAMRHYTFRIEPCADKRADPTKVGSVEGSSDPVRSSSNVAAFCTQHLLAMFTQSGAKVSDAGATAILKPELVVFDVLEAGMFNGEARIRFTLDIGGKVVYEATHEGKSKRWGRSHSPENYNEALSNGLAEATASLLRDDTFGKALTAAASGTKTASR